MPKMHSLQAPSLFFHTAHQNSGFASGVAVRKKFAKEINKYSGKTGGHGITFACKCSFFGYLIFQYT